MIWLMNLSNSWRLHFTLGSVLLLFYCYKPFFLLALAHGNAERGESLGGLGFTTIRQAFACLSRKLSIPNNLLGSIFYFCQWGAKCPLQPRHTLPFGPGVHHWWQPAEVAPYGGMIWVPLEPPTTCWLGGATNSGQGRQHCEPAQHSPQEPHTGI